MVYPKKTYDIAMIKPQAAYKKWRNTIQRGGNETAYFLSKIRGINRADEVLFWLFPKRKGLAIFPI